ncbi:MAG: 6-pyruvoyl-tetrahydropterin synthase-related protein [Chloroflexi bacterium]|nr:6-pyruvoyl-tetrahydropterin synthase-related protein [Chloroflexota bacterium]
MSVGAVAVYQPSRAAPGNGCGTAYIPIGGIKFAGGGGGMVSRWAPNFYHGYGYPIFNYYAPFSYYVGLPVEMLPWFDAVTAVKFVFMLGLCLGAVGVYGFVRDHWGRPAGYVATAVFLYAPYVVYIDPHARGVLAESWAVGLFPFALWLVDKLLRRPTAWRWGTAVVAASGLLLSHNLLGPLFLPCCWPG